MKDSLVDALRVYENIGLQLGKVARLVATLADPHVQEVRVYGGVVGLQQPALNGLSCTGAHTMKV